MAAHAPVHPVERIVAITAFHAGVTRLDLLSDRRDGASMRARQAVYWVTRHATSLSFPQIGARLNSRDHSTIQHGVARAETLRDRDPAFRLLTERVLNEYRQEQCA